MSRSHLQTEVGSGVVVELLQSGPNREMLPAGGLWAQVGHLVENVG